MKKGLQSIDFIGGLILFITLVVYIAFSVINVSKIHSQEVVSNSLHQEAWYYSQKIVENITSDSLTVDNARLAYYTDCLPGNIPKYTDIRTALGVGFDNAFRLVMTSYAVGIADIPAGQNYNGTVELQNIHSVTWIRNNNEYTTVLFDGSTQEYDANTSTSTPSHKELDGINYTIDKVDGGGQFILMSNVTSQCGIPPPLQTTVVFTERYLIRNNQPFKIRLEYW